MAKKHIKSDLFESNPDIKFIYYAKTNKGEKAKNN